MNYKVFAILMSISIVCVFTACTGNRAPITQTGGNTNLANLSLTKVNGYVSVSSGTKHTLSIKTDGSLWAWGNNQLGQIGSKSVPDNENVFNEYYPVKIMDDVDAILAKNNYSLAIKTDGSLWIWGGGTYHGTFGNVETWSLSEPTYIMDNVKSADITDRHLAILKTDGSLWLFESQKEILMFAAADELHTRMIKVAEQVKEISCAASFILMQNYDDELYAIELSDDLQMQREYVPENIAKDILSFSTYSTEGGFSGNVAIIKKDQTLWIRDASKNQTWIFEKSMDNVAAVSGGRGFAMAIKTDGSLWGWGVNSCGQIGDGTSDIYTPIGDIKEDYSKDVPVKILDGVRAVSCGDDFTMAIKTDGSLWAWGANPNGELGIAEEPDIYANQKFPARVLEKTIGG